MAIYQIVSFIFSIPERLTTKSFPGILKDRNRKLFIAAFLYSKCL